MDTPNASWIVFLCLPAIVLAVGYLHFIHLPKHKERMEYMRRFAIASKGRPK